MLLAHIHRLSQRLSHLPFKCARWWHREKPPKQRRKAVFCLVYQWVGTAVCQLCQLCARGWHSKNLVFGTYKPFLCCCATCASWHTQLFLTQNPRLCSPSILALHLVKPSCSGSPSSASWSSSLVRKKDPSSSLSAGTNSSLEGSAKAGSSEACHSDSQR